MGLWNCRVVFGVTCIVSVLIFMAGCNPPSELALDNGQHFVLPPTVLSFEDRDSWSLRHQFELKNHSSSEMHLKVQATSCGCTACNITQPVLKPGESSSIDLVVAVPYNRAHRSESVFIETGIPNEIHSFVLSGDVFPAVSNRPFQRKIFVTEPGSIEFDVIAYLKKGNDTGGLAVENDSHSINVQFGPPEIKDMESIVREIYPVKVDIVSAFSDETVVTFKSGNHVFPVTFHFHSEPMVTLSPSEVLFPKTSHENVSDRVQIELTGKLPFEVHEVLNDHQRVEVETLTSGPALSHQVAMRRVSQNVAGAESLKTVVQISVKTSEGELLTMDLLVYFIQ